MYPKMHPPPLSLREFADKEFDYLIVGGGTAGLVIANRLSEVPEFEVGIIEAGPPVFDDPALSRPGLFGLAMGSPHDWKFMSTPQPELRGRRVGFPRGKLLGGTSAMNFMAWTRGNREDYDAWVELGNPDWGWDDMLPFFKKTETFYKPDRIHQRQNYTYYQEEFHGTDGPIKNIHMQEYGPVQQYWHATMNEVGIQTSPDNMSGRNAGAWNMINTIDPTTQSRSWAANAYYLSVAHRANLHLVTEAMAREILLEEDGEGWIAKGVRVRSKGEELTVNAKRETIICAGAVQSPQLLEVSGVGNPSVLEPAGIGVKVKSLNVGENLREHLMTETVFEFSPELPSADDFKFNPEQRRLANFAYESSRTGPHTILPCAIAYCPLNKIVSPEHAADIGAKAKQIAKETGKPRETILSRQFDQDKILGQMEYVLDLSNWTSFFQGEPDKKYATIIQILLYPFSYGWIHIPPMQEGKPVTVDDSPVIDPRFFTDAGHIDYDIMTRALHFVDRIASAEPMREIIYRRVCPPVRSEDGKDEFEDHVRDTSLTDWHPIGTCAMGGNGGLEVGVVDPRLRVYGVKSLRVADASIFPLPISAHIMATVYAVGEKAAAMIIEDSGVEKPG